MATDPLAAVRAKLKAKPHVVTSAATPWIKGVTPLNTTAFKTYTGYEKLNISADPLAAVRANLKGGKVTAPTGLLPNESSGSLRLARLEAAVNAIALTFSGTQLSTLKSAVAAVK